MSAFARYDMKGALTENFSEHFGYPGLIIRRLSVKPPTLGEVASRFAR